MRKKLASYKDKFNQKMHRTLGRKKKSRFGSDSASSTHGYGMVLNNQTIVISIKNPLSMKKGYK